jgi:hypothetical protein
VSEHHPTASELERYVIGAQAPDEAQKIETHVAGCASCATALAREAQLEVKLQEVARTSPPVAIRDHRAARRVAIVGALGVLAAAAALLVIPFAGSPEERGDPDPGIVGVSPAPDAVSVNPDAELTQISGIACIDPASATECTRDAHRRGLAVMYPTIQVPHYEYAAADQLR